MLGKPVAGFFPQQRSQLENMLSGNTPYLLWPKLLYAVELGAEQDVLHGSGAGPVLQHPSVSPAPRIPEPR